MPIVWSMSSAASPKPFEATPGPLWDHCGHAGVLNYCATKYGAVTVHRLAVTPRIHQILISTLQKWQKLGLFWPPISQKISDLNLPIPYSVCGILGKEWLVYVPLCTKYTFRVSA